MTQGIFKLVFSTSLAVAVGVAFAQTHDSTRSSSGGGGSHSSSSPTRSSGGNSGSTRSNGSHDGGSSRNSGSGITTRDGGGSGVWNFGGDRSGLHTISDDGNHSSGGWGSRYGRSVGDSSKMMGSSDPGQFGQGRGGGGGDQSNRGGRGSSETHVWHDSAQSHQRTGPSHSGTVTYSSNNNMRTSARVPSTERVSIAGARPGLIRPGGVGGRVFGTERGGVGLVRNGWRYGYYSYWHDWHDSYFWYPFYAFEPGVGPCYCSPWYYYPCLPPYIGAPRVVIVDSFPSAGWSGDEYDWQPVRADSQARSDLDYSVQDLVSSFQNDDHQAIERLAPRNGNVNIYVDGKYSYSLGATDFYDTYIDGIESTKTDRYEILDVKMNRDGTARVTAKHVYTDPWGARAYVYHSYFLVHEGNEFVIREFGTSNYKAN